MKTMVRTNPILRVSLLLLTVLGLTAPDSRSVASAQFLEDYAHAGILRTFKGQVRFSDDTPISGATLRITSLKNDKDDAIEADEDGNFMKADLPSGKYKINVRGTGSNIGEFTVRISQGSPSTSSKYIIVKSSSYLPDALPATLG